MGSDKILGYFKYLSAMVQAGPGMTYENYEKLLSDMFGETFFWDGRFLSDESRANSGMALRLGFFDENDLHIMSGIPCTVLEALIAIAIRIENEFTGEPGNDHPEVWFWTMVNNLGLSDMTDDNYDHERVCDVLSTWMKREFKHNGLGGLFPLRHTMIDQRLIPIWDQMCMYLRENVF